MLMGVDSAGLKHHAVACAQGGGQFPGGHQDGEVPGNDLADHAQWLLNVVRHGVLVDIAEGAFLRAHATGEITKVVHRERNVGIQGFADRLAVVDGLGVGQQFEVGFDAVGNFEQDVAARGGIGFAPGVSGGVGGVQCQFDVFGGGAGGLGVDLAADGRDDVKVLALDRCHPFAADEVVVLGLVGNLGTGGAGGCVNHGSVRRFREPLIAWPVPVPGLAQKSVQSAPIRALRRPKTPVHVYQRCATAVHTVSKRNR
jgi:hypothetical protein